MESTKITVVGYKNGRKLKITWENGEFLAKSAKNFIDLTKYQYELVRLGNNYNPEAESPVKAMYAFTKFFDRMISVKYNGDDPRMKISDKNDKQ